MTKEACRAKVTEAPDGSYIMWMEGEKYPFPGYPRGHLLYGSLSLLKHQIKNQIFNDAWKLYEDKVSPLDIIKHIKTVAYPNILQLGHDVRHDMMPYERMVPAVKEIHRAMTASGVPNGLRDIICFIFNEDDAYRFRFQWLVTHLGKRRVIENFAEGMELMAHAEVVDDMKDRVRLVKRVLLLLTMDYQFSKIFAAFIKELDFKKVKLTKADKYFFRAKYFKVDYPWYEY